MATPAPLSPEAEEEAWELLYEAYNELQALATELGGAAAPAPAVVVVGHQTDGKSALVEALMGFQFNHVGGGTKTRRPVALHLRFNPRCDEPQCRLLAGPVYGADGDDDAGLAGRPMSLADIQAYIEAENLRLENDPCQFSEKEIIIKVEYKHCPNLTIIDTPGLILPAPGRKNRVLQTQASAVESLVRAKIQHEETIILCLEDCSDWSNATTRRVVMQNAGMRLYGGAQSHRAMAEFRLVIGNIKCPPIAREEIVNASGVEDIHDGTNYSRTACVIAVAKARDTFEPFLHQLGFRLLYILKRLIPISVYLLEKDGDHFSSHQVLVKRVQAAFKRFAESTEQSCRERCMEDLESTTRYVTWSLHNKNRAGLRHFLDSFVAPEQLPVNTHTAHSTAGLHDQSSGSNDSKQDRPKGDLNSSSTVPETRLVDLLDSTLWNRRLVPSSERLVYALVHQIFHGIKEHFLVTTELKFNCFLLMPIVDKLPALLRQDLESALEDELDSIFDVTQLRQSFGQRKRELEIELKRIKRLKEKFGEINKKLNSLQVRQ